MKLFCYKNKPCKLPLCHTGTSGIDHFIRQLENQVLFSNEEFKHYGERGILYSFLQNADRLSIRTFLTFQSISQLS